MPRVLAFVADPVYASKRLHERFGWTNPFTGVAQAVEDLNVAFGWAGLYTLETVEIPLPGFGARNPDQSRTHIDEINLGDPTILSPAQWVQKWESTGWNPPAWPGGGELHIRHFLQTHVLPRLGTFDEVWLDAMPFPMAFEGAMLAPETDYGAPRVGSASGITSGFGVGPIVPCTLSLPKDLADSRGPATLDWLKAYRTHDTLVNVPELTKRYVLAMFQVSNHNPLHNYVHRCEAILNYIWGSGWNGYQEQWGEPMSPMNLNSYNELLGMTENGSKGIINGAGSGHFHCNTKVGYEYRMNDVVPSIAHMFKRFPEGFPINLQDVPRLSRLVSAKTWANFREPQQWWLAQLPRNPGKTDSRWNDWTKYVMDVNDETGRGEPTTRPVVGNLPSLPKSVTKHGNRAIVRWEPDPGDPGDVVYRLSVDGVDAGSLKRWNSNHVRLSWEVPLGRDYRIKADYPGGRERVFNVNVPTPDTDPIPPPPPEPEGPMLSLEEVKAEIEELHRTVLAGCKAPDSYVDESVNVVRLRWNAVAGESIGIIRFWTVDELRTNYPTTYRGHPKLKLLCGTVPTPPPPPVTDAVPPPDDGYPTRPATAVYSPQELWAGLWALHKPGGRMASCPGPVGLSVNSSSNYVLEFDARAGNQSMTMNQRVPLATMLPVYEGTIYASLRKYCSDVVVPPPPPPPPPPDPVDPPPLPDPTPTPTNLGHLYETEALAHEAAARVWRERKP